MEGGSIPRQVVAFQVFLTPTITGRDDRLDLSTKNHNLVLLQTFVRADDSIGIIKRSS
jgi:hypothetical protein